MAADFPHDADLTFDQQAERGAKAAMEAVRTSVSEACRRELDALRTEFDARLGAIQLAVANSDLATPIERLAWELSRVAALQTEDAANQARFEAKLVAEEQLASVQAAARASLEQAQADHAALLRTIDAMQAQTQAAVSAAQADVHAIREELAAEQQQAMAARQEGQDRAADLEATRRRLEMREEACVRLEQALASSQERLSAEAHERTALAVSLEAAQSATAAARADADVLQAANANLRGTMQELHEHMHAATSALSESEMVRAELTATIEKARGRHAELSAQLTAALEDAATARREVQERAARLESTEQRLQDLETRHERAQTALAQGDIRLAAEVQNSAALTTALETARHAAAAASAQLDASRAELHETCAHIEGLQQQLAAQPPDVAVLGRLRRSIQAFAGLSDTRDLLTTFLQELTHAFDRVALFIVRENRLQGWDSVGFEPTTSVSNLLIPFSVDTPLTRAATGRTSIVIEDEADEPTPGLLGHETYGSVAIPIATDRGHIAVVYAEFARRLAPGCGRAEMHAADVLGEHVRGLIAHLERVPAAAAASTGADAFETGASAPQQESRPALAGHPGPVRAARRVRMSDRVEVVIDGADAELIDLSNLGAQVTSARMIRPNRQVRMVIPRASLNTPCSGHVVWALFEMTPDGGRYRAGLKFTSVDDAAVEAFLSQQRASLERTSA